MALSRVGKAALITGILLVALGVVLVVAVAVLVPLSQDAARERLIAALSQRFDAKVELNELRLQVVPTIRAEGRGLTIRLRGRTDVPPLITVPHFSAEGSLLSFLNRHVSRVDIDGLDIEIPPDRDRNAATDSVGGTRPPADDDSRGVDADFAHRVIVDELHAAGARLKIIPSEEGKPPKVWAIHDLRMKSLGIGRAMPFQATLTNAIPPGEIVTDGSFGPWRQDEPGETPLDGVFTFDRADLSVFTGISGLLEAHGRFGGKLERVDIHGETDTPQFRVVRTGGHAVPMHTVYHAIVDGTNGNTILEDVNAKILNTTIVAKGSVIGKPRVDGRTVSLDVTIDGGRLEDIMRMVVGTPKAPMTGGLRLKTRFVLPPGNADVVKRLRLDGQFSLTGARFTSAEVQQKIVELSRRASGKVRDNPEGASAPNVTSKFDGRFKLGDGRLAIPDVTFDVPGAAVQLAGEYALLPETINFSGTLFMDVKVSDTTTGIKHVLLKLVDPLFKRDGGGSAIPIKIDGTRSDPSFGLDAGRVFSRKRHSPSAPSSN
ncbi:MAG TPA: AsmA-like C-terminal region-containing protein [Vicinamibacterales bacterium]|nr:AsmA-like C-terminal region-containing protein [Vicinamibacterales bacterium]